MGKYTASPHRRGSPFAKVLHFKQAFTKFLCLQRQKRYSNMEEALREAYAHNDLLQAQKVSQPVTAVVVTALMVST